MAQVKSSGGLPPTTPCLGGPFFIFLIQTFNCLGETHLHYGGQSAYSKFTNLFFYILKFILFIYLCI